MAVKGLSRLAEVLEENRKFGGLHGAERLDGFISRWTDRRVFTGVDEGERIPPSTRDQFCFKHAVVSGAQQRGGLRGQFRETRMRTDAVEPVFGVAVVRLAPVHETVDITAVGALNGLGDGVRRIQVVVPEQDESVREFTSISRQRHGVGGIIELLVKRVH